MVGIEVEQPRRLVAPGRMGRIVAHDKEIGSAVVLAQEIQRTLRYGICQVADDALLYSVATEAIVAVMMDWIFAVERKPGFEPGWRHVVHGNMPFAGKPAAIASRIQSGGQSGNAFQPVLVVEFWVGREKVVHAVLRWHQTRHQTGACRRTDR